MSAVCHHGDDVAERPLVTGEPMPPLSSSLTGSGKVGDPRPKKVIATVTRDSKSEYQLTSKQVKPGPGRWLRPLAFRLCLAEHALAHSQLHYL